MKISKGNSKLGAIPNVSLTPIRSCANCSACRRDCYALKAYRQHPATKRAWDHNFQEATHARGDYFRAIGAWLHKARPAFFRWHVSGDILDQEYLDYMIEVALDLPGTVFLAFTKRGDLEYSSAPGNLRIRFSQWPGMPELRAPGILGAWMQDGTETRIPASAIKCPGSCENCRACWNSKKDVYFLKH